MSKRQLAIIISIFFSYFSHAQDSTTVSALDEVVITANKYSKKQSETGKVVTVIGRDQLERSSGRTLGEVLNAAVGTTIIGTNNNLGANQTVSIRGGSAGNVLILVDGIPVNDPSVNTNHFDLNFFSVDQIERIEILKGGQSTLYGSDAVSGVINIITKKSSTKGQQKSLHLSAGSYNTYKGNIGIQGKTEQSLYSIQYGFLSSGGFSSAFDSIGNKDFDKDGYRQHNITGAWHTSITKKLQANLFGLFSHYKTGLDAAAFTDEKDFMVTNNNYQAGAGMMYTISKGTIQLNYRYNYTRRSYLDDSTFRSNSFVNFSKSRYEGKTHFAELYGNWKWNHAELLTGIDFRKNLTDQETFYDYSFGQFTSKLDDSLAHMSQFSPYASFILKTMNGFSVEFGGRWNHHSVYGNNFTYTINPSILINERIKLFSNLYSAFKTPTLYQLFDPLIGNNLLEAERSIVFEAGTQLFLNNSIHFRTLYFYRSTDDAIQYIILDPGTFAAQYKNVSNQKTYGIETEANYRAKKWNISANYTYTDGRLRSRYDETGSLLAKDTSIHNIYRIPANALNISAGVQLNKSLYIGPILRVVGKRLDPVYASTPVILDSYYTLDIYSEYRFNKNIKAFIDLKNITDQQYDEVFGYNTRRFNFTAGLGVKW